MGGNTRSSTALTKLMLAVYALRRGTAMAERARAAVVACAFPALLGGCGIYSIPKVEPLGPVSAHQALIEARNANWRVRVTLVGSQVEGRAAFVTDTTVQIGGQVQPLSEVNRLERWANTDLGGRPAGALVGGFAGVLAAAAYRGFWEFGFERGCDAVCTFTIFIPTIAIDALAGTMVGSIVHRPKGRWTTVWRMQ